MSAITYHVRLVCGNKSERHIVPIRKKLNQDGTITMAVEELERCRSCGAPIFFYECWSVDGEICLGVMQVTWD